MTKAVVMPLRPPTYPPRVIRTSVSAVSRNVVRRALIWIPSNFFYANPSSKLSVSPGSLRRCRLFRLDALETHSVLLSIAIHANMVSRKHFAFEDLQRQRILDHALNCLPQRPCAIRRIVSLAHQKFLCCWR